MKCVCVCICGVDYVKKFYIFTVTVHEIPCLNILFAGMPQVGALSFKTLFIDNIKLKRNWRLGQYAVTTLTAHTHR